jgi:hypothetical protein
MINKLNLTIAAAFAILLGGIMIAWQTSSPQVSTSASIAPASVELHSFGDEEKYAVLLDLASTEIQPASDIVFLTNTSDAVPDSSICTHTGVSVTSAPSDTRLGNTDDLPIVSTMWRQGARWLNLPLQDEYVILMWSPDAPNNTYSLVSGDPSNAPVVCSDEIDGDV